MPGLGPQLLATVRLQQGEHCFTHPALMVEIVVNPGVVGLF
jgi:hypothetical protein